MVRYCLKEYCVSKYFYYFIWFSLYLANLWRICKNETQKWKGPTSVTLKFISHLILIHKVLCFVKDPSKYSKKIIRWNFLYLYRPYFQQRQYKDFNKDIHQDITNKSINQDINKYIHKDINRDFNIDINKDIIKNIHQGINNCINQDINIDIHQDTNKYFNKEINQNINKDINQYIWLLSITICIKIDQKCKLRYFEKISLYLVNLWKICKNERRKWKGSYFCSSQQSLYSILVRKSALLFCISPLQVLQLKRGILYLFVIFCYIYIIFLIFGQFMKNL